MAEPTEVLTTEETADLLRVATKTVLGLAGKGELPGCRQIADDQVLDSPCPSPKRSRMPKSATCCLRLGQLLAARARITTRAWSLAGACGGGWRGRRAQYHEPGRPKVCRAP
jgi:hypothetical protein